MSKLEDQVRNEDPVNVLVSSLAFLTRIKSLYGGDLETAVAVLRTVASRVLFSLQEEGRSVSASFPNKRNHIREVLQNVFHSAKDILSPAKSDAWADLDREAQMKVATQLLLALEENAFLLAGVMDEPDIVLESSEVLSKFSPCISPALTFP